MSVLIRLKRQRAVLRQGAWLSSNPRFEEQLNAAMEAWIEQTGGPAVSDPDPEKTAAAAIASQLGAKIVAHVRANGSEARRLYHDRRQMRIPFG